MSSFMNYTVIIDAGHGAIDPKTGNYTTAPSKQWFHEGLELHNGGWFYEGVFNRKVATKTIEKFRNLNFNVFTTYHEWQDTPLKTRTDKAKQLHKNTNSVLISIHANAATNAPSANGFEIYTTKGDTPADKLASEIYENVLLLFGREIKSYRTDTTDGDVDKEEDFYVLRKVPQPATLLECGFFTNRREAEWLMDDAVQDKFAEAIVLGTVEYFKNVD